MSDPAILPWCHNSSILTVAFGGKTDMNDGNFRYLGLVEKFVFACMVRGRLCRFWSRRVTWDLLSKINLAVICRINWSRERNSWLEHGVVKPRAWNVGTKHVDSSTQTILAAKKAGQRAQLTDDRFVSGQRLKYVPTLSCFYLQMLY